MTAGVMCPRCGCPLQRSSTGTLQDGVAAHYATVHPGLPVPLVRPAQ